MFDRHENIEHRNKNLCAQRATRLHDMQSTGTCNVRARASRVLQSEGELGLKHSVYD